MAAVHNLNELPRRRGTQLVGAIVLLGCLSWVSLGTPARQQAAAQPARSSAGGVAAAAAGEGASVQGGGPVGSTALAAATAAAAAAEALQGGPATLYGPVEKTGWVDASCWHPRYTTLINQQFSQWISNRTEHGTLSPSMFPGCAIWANHKYKIIFVRHPKCATTSVLSHFTLCKEGSGLDSCLEMWNGNKNSSVANLSSAEIEEMWRDYFVFTVVRNPLSRAVSSYKFVLSGVIAEPQCNSQMDWDSFCEDPVLAGEICRKKKQCCPFGGGLFAFAHIIDQARCMQTKAGGLAVDYVARVEHLSEDMAEVYAEINRRRGEGVPPLKIPPSMKKVNTAQGKSCDQIKLSAEHGRLEHAAFFGRTFNYTSTLAKESAYCTMQQFYEGRHAHCLNSIARAYGADLTMLYPQ